LSIYLAMTEVFLKFIDETGEPQEISVDSDKFSIGRSPDNELAISNNSLSRNHILIERFADVFIVSDCGSSNGSKLNGDYLYEPTALSNGDKLNLGDSLDIDIKIISQSYEVAEVKPETKNIVEKSPSVSVKSTEPKSSFSPMIFIIAPLLFLVIFLIAGVSFIFLRSKPDVVENRDIYINSDNPAEKENKDDDPVDDPTPKPTTKIESNSANSTETPRPSKSPDEIEVTATPKISNELEKVEKNAYSFMRKIAENDSNPILTNPQLQILAAKINQVKSFSSLRDNFKSARQGKSNIENLARERNLKPQLLAVAALAKLGNERGDVSANASQMRDVLNELREVVGNNLADDCLLMIAAYNEGVNKEKFKMRDRLAQLTKGSQLSARQIRTIWYLKETGKISDAQFELAIRFLAIGTISQNPKEFGVSEEALNF
jgi:pSer/pThr/pTyr-binding forkhead associated (FHA) protein